MIKSSTRKKRIYQRLNYKSPINIEEIRAGGLFETIEWMNKCFKINENRKNPVEKWGISLLTSLYIFNIFVLLLLINWGVNN